MKIEVSCVDASNATLVAAIFNNQNTFATSRPKDKSWSILEDIDDHQRHSCHDILFYEGTLHALIYYEDEADVNGAFAPMHSMRVGADHDEEVVVKLIPVNVSLRISSWTLNPPANLVPIDESEKFWILKDATLRSFLVESDGELLDLLQVLNIVEGTFDLMVRPIMKLVITAVMMMVIVSMTAVIIPEAMKLAAKWALMVTMMLVTRITTSMMYYMYEKHGDIDDHIDNVHDEDNEDDEDNNDINGHNDEDDDDDENHDNGNHNHDYGDEDFKYCQTSKFEVFKIEDLSAHNMSVTRLDDLGDRPLFVSLSGSISVQVSKFNELKKRRKKKTFIKRYFAILTFFT